MLSHLHAVKYFKRRDPNDRSQIPNVNQVGVPRSVDINLVEIVTKLSDEFDLNELEATNFVVAALQRSVVSFTHFLKTLTHVGNSFRIHLQGRY